MEAMLKYLKFRLRLLFTGTTAICLFVIFVLAPLREYRAEQKRIAEFPVPLSRLRPAINVEDTNWWTVAPTRFVPSFN